MATAAAVQLHRPMKSFWHKVKFKFEFVAYRLFYFCICLFVWLFTLSFQCGQYQIPLWIGHSLEMIHTHKRTITPHTTSHKAHCCTKINTEATEVIVYGFFYKLMCSGNQKMHELMMMTIMRTRRKNQIFNYGFLWNSYCFYLWPVVCVCVCVCVCVEKEYTFI